MNDYTRTKNINIVDVVFPFWIQQEIASEVPLNKLRAIQLFVRLADLQSFAAVAREYNATSSMVSKEIGKLEENLGARLLHRSTRRLQLTPIGEGYLNRCRDILEQMNNADAYVDNMQNNLNGRLRINIPMSLGLTDLGKAFADFMTQYPGADLDIHLGDEDLDLIEHGFDLGFRASSQPFNSNYVGKPLRTFTYRICASPKYVDQHTPIENVYELQNHRCFVYSYFRGGNHWPVNSGIDVRGPLKVNNTLFMRDAMEAGLGIGFLPSFVADPSIAKGLLIELFEDSKKPLLTLYALYPNRRHVPPILAKCIDFMKHWFQ